MEGAGLKKNEIDEIVLVGGSTRIPKIRQLVKEFFNGKEPNTGINPDEAICFGAAVQGGIICDDHVSCGCPVFIDEDPLSLGIETVGEIAKITRDAEENAEAKEKIEARQQLDN